MVIKISVNKKNKNKNKNKKKSTNEIIDLKKLRITIIAIVYSQE